ncbi:MAG: toll/interleukin-1 receptor domain-containing protein [Verrucomicrobiota bacterium]
MDNQTQMGTMKHVFISHAGEDAEIAKRLENDLRNASHETKIDARELKLGDDTIEFMNQGIADAHTVIILYSQHTPKAKWQNLEIKSAVWNEVAQSGGVCIVVRLDDSAIPPVLGPKVYGKLNAADPSSYRKLLEDLCGAILPGKTASSLVSEAFKCESTNPFRRVRAEYFEDRPDLLAKTFAPPDALKQGALEEMKPCFLEGSRGTGKSMLLLSLRARNFLSRHKGNSKLVSRYATNAKSILDPFCGSGAVLVAGSRNGIPTTGIDVNPIAALLSQVKLAGFCLKNAMALADELVQTARKTKRTLPIQWAAKGYWFTPATLDKYERLRAASLNLALNQTSEGMAVLLSFALSVRLCSKADQRSPKPFISKLAIARRKGKHFDPYQIIPALLTDLGEAYGPNSGQNSCRFLLADMASDASIPRLVGKHSHVITSPPYINAQDYFRNFKLELNLLEGVLPFQVGDLQECFIGTERGDLLAGISLKQIQQQRERVPQIKALARKAPRSEAVVHRYLHDMGNAFDTIQKCLEYKGTFVLVCGDNLIGGLRIRTWQLLTNMLVERGFKLFDTFTDRIEDRMLAPKRCGHKGLIKEEVILAFRSN